MNRRDFRELAVIRLREAQALLAGEFYDGAYYLCGYAVECALKACIARRTRQHDFPDRTFANQVYSHDPTRLVVSAGLEAALQQEIQGDGAFERNWNTVRDWTEASRYQRTPQANAVMMYAAVADRRHGVLRWLRRHW